MTKLEHAQLSIINKLLNPDDECLIWEFHKDHCGYGRCNVGSIKGVKVHRIALEMKLERALTELALHTCRNPSCYSPFHLYEGSRKQNMLDRFIDKTSTRHVFQKNNTSGFKGVSRKKNRWLAQIWINNVIHRLGAYDTPEDAARAYDAAALKAWGTDCYLNFP